MLKIKIKIYSPAHFLQIFLASASHSKKSLSWEAYSKVTHR